MMIATQNSASSSEFLSTSQQISHSRGSDGTYVLYHSEVSMRSMMIRLLIQIRGGPRDDEARMRIEFHHIDIFKYEQFGEAFLRDVNLLGKVPVLANTVMFDRPLANTVAISAYITERYPHLRPERHAYAMKELIAELHEISFFSLSFVDKPEVPEAFVKEAERRISDVDSSEWYRTALKQKLARCVITEYDMHKPSLAYLAYSSQLTLSRITDEMVLGIEPDKVQQAAQKATVVLAKASASLDPNCGPWLFGQSEPTEVDAHIAVFLSRLTDAGHQSLIPEELKSYLSMVKTTQAWKAAVPYGTSVRNHH